LARRQGSTDVSKIEAEKKSLEERGGCGNMTKGSNSRLEGRIVFWGRSGGGTTS